MDSGVVNIRGKQYQTVALRVSFFREKHPAWSLLTEVLSRDDKCVLVKASILDESGRTIATGHAEEYRQASAINKTSAIENAETSAIGRALAGLGFGGTEFATADEVAHAISGKPQAPVINPVEASMEGEPPIDQAKVDKIAGAFIDFYEADRTGSDTASYGAFELSESLDTGMQLAVWLALKEHSKVRAWIKKCLTEHRQPA